MKDLEDAAGFRTTQGSAVYADSPIATTDSPLVERLKAAGCIVVGKTNTPEGGHKADTVNPLFGATGNPWDLTRSAGGSSGGSAAAIAAGLVPLCTGSDGGGSIRIPSSVCGISGMKPSLGRVPVGGPKPPGWADLSTRGPMAARVRDITLALDTVVGPDATDLRVAADARHELEPLAAGRCTPPARSAGRRRSATPRSTARCWRSARRR